MARERIPTRPEDPALQREFAKFQERLRQQTPDPTPAPPTSRRPPGIIRELEGSVRVRKR